MSGLVDAWAREQLAVLEAQALVRELEPLESPVGPTVMVGGRTLVNFSSNDFLGLANHRRVLAAAHHGLDLHGFGAGGSRLAAGDTLAHHALEDALAAFSRTEAALLFGSSTLANHGVLPVLVGPGDIVFSDERNHASLVDGCRLARAQVVVYPHLDVNALVPLVGRYQGRRRLLVTESVFALDGDRAPLKELAQVAEHGGLGLYVDESNAVGVLGPAGRGLAEEAGVTADVSVGSLSKALGTLGSWVATTAPTRRLLLSRARTVMLSGALPAFACAAALAAVQKAQRDPSLRARLWSHVNTFARGLTALKLPAPTCSPVFSVILGRTERALEAAAALRERGFLVKAVRPPSVPEETSRLRICLSAAHDAAHVEGLVFALGEVLR